MQTIQLKYDIISWITALDDKKLILKVHRWIEEQKSAEIAVASIRNGSLTEEYGIWSDDAQYNEANCSDQYEQLKNAFLNSSKRSMAQQIEKYIS